jgi:hypothetical protein
MTSKEKRAKGKNWIPAFTGMTAGVETPDYRRPRRVPYGPFATRMIKRAYARFVAGITNKGETASWVS